MLNTAIKAAKEAGYFLNSNFRTIEADLPSSHNHESRSSVSTHYDNISNEIIIDRILKSSVEHNIPVVIYSEESGYAKYDVHNNIRKRITISEKDFFEYGGTKWVIDPVCGSIPYARGVADFIISLAILKEREVITGVVYDPVQNEMFYGEKGKGAYLNGAKVCFSNTSNFSNSYISIEHKLFRTSPPKKIKQLVSEIQRIRVAGTCALEMAYVACGRLDAVIKLNQPVYDYAAGMLIVNEANVNSGGMYSIRKFEKLPERINNRPLSFICGNKKIAHKLSMNLKDWDFDIDV